MICCLPLLERASSSRKLPSSAAAFSHALGSLHGNARCVSALQPRVVSGDARLQRLNDARLRPRAPAARSLALLHKAARVSFSAGGNALAQSRAPRPPAPAPRRSGSAPRIRRFSSAMCAAASRIPCSAFPDHASRAAPAALAFRGLCLQRSGFHSSASAGFAQLSREARLVALRAHQEYADVQPVSARRSAS